MSRKILIVEDEEKIARFVELELVHEGYEVIKAFDGRTGLDLALSEHAQLWLAPCSQKQIFHVCIAN